MMVPFNIPWLSGQEQKYVNDVLNSAGKRKSIDYTAKCIDLLRNKWGFGNPYLTSSCTAALEMSALLIDVKPDDEIIIPSFTYPSTANAFMRQGAKIVLADSRKTHPGMDELLLESLITVRTKAIVPVHYAGISCNMYQIMKIADKYNLFVIEDSALAFDSFLGNKPLGSIGHIGCLSFHSSKNLHCMEGGALIINDERFKSQVPVIIAKGTNKHEFDSGKVSRYEWSGIGSAYSMSEIHAAFLLAQMEKAEWIKEKRLNLWNMYYESLKVLEYNNKARLPAVPDYAGHNAHTFYLVLNSNRERNALLSFLNQNGIQATFHYTSLDLSTFWKKHSPMTNENVNSRIFNDCLLRMPLYNSMESSEVEYVSSAILKYFDL